MRDQAGSYCHRLATRILQINNLQPELQNSAAPSTRGCNTVSCLHLVCPIPSYTPWDQDQFISFLTNGTYVQAQSRCSHISAPSHTVLEKHLLRQHSPSLPASTSPPSFPSTPLFLPCPYPTSIAASTLPQLLPSCVSGPYSTPAPTTPSSLPPHSYFPLHLVLPASPPGSPPRPRQKQQSSFLGKFWHHRAASSTIQGFLPTSLSPVS